jgi:hypothetical protein
MKTAVALCVLATSAFLTTVHATTNSNYQSATVVSVESSPANTLATNASSDAPLAAATYSYNVGIRLGNVVYQTTYNSAFEGVSPLFTNQAVQVDLKHNTMLVNLPGNRTVPLAIAGRSAE